MTASLDRLVGILTTAPFTTAVIAVMAAAAITFLPELASGESPSSEKASAALAYGVCDHEDAVARPRAGVDEAARK
jgi:hypothetical protein